MECTICKSGKMKDGKVTVTLQRNDSIIVIKKVPASVCEKLVNIHLRKRSLKRSWLPQSKLLLIMPKLKYYNMRLNEGIRMSCEWFLRTWIR